MRIRATGVLAVAVALACAGGAQADEKKDTTSEVKCQPGAIWTVKDPARPNSEDASKVYAVCDKDGKWVKVINLVRPTASIRLAATKATTLARAAEAKKDDAGSKPACPEFGGGKLGDRKTLTETTYVNGKKVTKSYDVICGDDGRWHQVAKSAAPFTRIPPKDAQITTAERRR